MKSSVESTTSLSPSEDAGAGPTPGPRATEAGRESPPVFTSPTTQGALFDIGADARAARIKTALGKLRWREMLACLDAALTAEEFEGWGVRVVGRFLERFQGRTRQQWRDVGYVGGWMATTLLRIRDQLKDEGEQDAMAQRHREHVFRDAEGERAERARIIGAAHREIREGNAAFEALPADRQAQIVKQVLSMMPIALLIAVDQKRPLYGLLGRRVRQYMANHKNTSSVDCADEGRMESA